MSDFELLLQDTGETTTASWATVTQASPLRIKIDGDTNALGYTPDSLISGLVVNSRVLVQRFNRRLTIVGKSGGSEPTGVVSSFAGSSAPTGWLLCDGSAVSRTTYAALFALINTTYGVGDGSTTFNIPNLKGKVPVGLDSGQTEFDTMGETGGEKAHTLTIGEMPSHDHGGSTGSSVAYNTTAVYSAGGAVNLFALSWGGSFIGNDATYQSRTAHTHSVTAQGSGSAHNNLQPYLVLNYIIKT